MTGGTPQTAKNGSERRKLGEVNADIQKSLGKMGDLVVEGLMTSRAEIEEKVDRVRADANGAKEAAKEVAANSELIKMRADSIEKAAGEASSSAVHAQSQASIASESAARAEAALTDISADLELLSTKNDEGKEVKGVAAVEVAVRKAERVGAYAKAAVDAVVKTEVTASDDEGKEVRVEKSGAQLMAHFSESIDLLRAAVGGAVSKSEHAESLLETAKGLIESVKQSNGETIQSLQAALGEAHTAAAESKAAAVDAKGLVEGNLQKIADALDTMKVTVSTIAAVLLRRADLKNPDIKEVLEAAAADDSFSLDGSGQDGGADGSEGRF
ncbi:MAG: hypothetical protein U0R44_05955 [Candidatus Micrarchaeia archaeon]